MLALKIILVIAVLIVLLCMTRVGAHAVFADGNVTVDARVGLIRFRVSPRPPKKEKPPKEKTAKQIAKEEKAKAAKEAKEAQKKAEKKAKPIHFMTDRQQQTESPTSVMYLPVLSRI